MIRMRTQRWPPAPPPEGIAAPMALDEEEGGDPWADLDFYLAEEC